jgi:hypothetical protein
MDAKELAIQLRSAGHIEDADNVERAIDQLERKSAELRPQLDPEIARIFNIDSARPIMSEQELAREISEEPSPRKRDMLQILKVVGECISETIKCVLREQKTQDEELRQRIAALEEKIGSWMPPTNYLPS